MQKKKLVSMLLATTIISGAMVGKSVITKANTVTKKKESKSREVLPNFEDMSELAKYYVDKLEQYLNEKDYDLDFWIKRTNLVISRLGTSETDKELTKRYSALKQRYEREKKSGDTTGIINKLKRNIDNNLDLTNEDIKDKRYTLASDRLREVKESINALSKYGDSSVYTDRLKKIEKILWDKQVEMQQKENEKEKEKTMKEIIDKNINSLEADLNNKKYENLDSLINQIKFKINKFNEKNKLDQATESKFNLLEKRYLKEKPRVSIEPEKKYDQIKQEPIVKQEDVVKEEKLVVIPPVVKTIKEETKTLIDSLATQVVKGKDSVEVKKTINTVEKKIEEIKKYKKVDGVENILKEIKDDLQSGKEVNESKITQLKENLEKAIVTEEENKENVENIVADEIATPNSEDNLNVNDKDLLEKEVKEYNKSLAVKVGAGIGAILLGAGAFLMNKRFRRKH